MDAALAETVIWRCRKGALGTIGHFDNYTNDLTAMLLFIETPLASLDQVREDGLQTASGEPVLLHDLPPVDSELRSGKVVLAIATTLLVEHPLRLNGKYGLSYVPPRAILNLDPYRPVRRVAAAGGYVVRLRPGTSEPDLLLIHRRGVWDLPKGKLDRGETPEQGALREVCEEAGIGKLDLVRSVGWTLHGYDEKGSFMAKTTHWFLMTTEQETFTPEEKEGIDRVEWMPWSKARAAIPFPNLQAHMDSLGMESLIP